MLIRYIIFCVGCGLLQTAAARTPRDADPYDVPIAFANPRVHFMVQTIAFSSVIAEVWVGFSLFRWVGLIIWVPGILVGNLIFPGKNPGPCFLVGILVTTIGGVLLFIA